MKSTLSLSGIAVVVVLVNWMEIKEKMTDYAYWREFSYVVFEKRLIYRCERARRVTGLNLLASSATIIASPLFSYFHNRLQLINLRVLLLIIDTSR